MRKDLVKSNEAKTELEAQIQQLRSDLEKSAQDVHDIRTQKENIENKSGALFELEKRIDQLSQQNQQLLTQQQDMQERAESALKERDEIQRVADDLADEILEVKSAAERQEAEFSEHLEHVMESHRKECEVFEAENSELRGRVSDLESELHSARGEIEACRDRIEELHGIRDRLVAEIAKLEGHLSELASRLSASEAQKEALQVQNRALTVEIPAKFQTKLEALQEQALEAQMASERQISRLNRRLEKRDSEIEHLRGVWRMLLVSHPELDKVIIHRRKHDDVYIHVYLYT